MINEEMKKNKDITGLENIITGMETICVGKNEDKYTADVLRKQYTLYRNNYIETAETIKTTGLPIRHQNLPEDITENIVKFIIINYDNDPSCKWAKSMKLTGDLYSDKTYTNFNITICSCRI